MGELRSMREGLHNYSTTVQSPVLNFELAVIHPVFAALSSSSPMIRLFIKVLPVAGFRLPNPW